MEKQRRLGPARTASRNATTNPEVTLSMSINEGNNKNVTRICSALGCRRGDGIEILEDGTGRVRALCPSCAAGFGRRGTGQTGEIRQ